MRQPELRERYGIADASAPESGRCTDEGVVLFFVADRGGFAVAAEHDGIVGQCKQLRVNRPSQLFEATTRKVGPSDTALKEHVATEHDPRAVVFVYEYHMP